MTTKSKVLRAAAASLGVAAVTASASARAATCSSIIPSGSNPVFVSGASVAQPLVQALAAAVAPLNISIVYSAPDSCLGVQDFLEGAPSTETGAKTNYVSPSGALTACTLAATQVPDIAVSEVYASTCGFTPDGGTVNTANTVDVLGPINAMVFAVPGGTSGSTATSISAEAAYVVFGYDAQGYSVSPWTQQADIFVREQTSGAEAQIGVAIGLPTGKWQNATTGSPSAQQKTTAGAMTTALSTATANEPAVIGVSGAENVYSFNASVPSGQLPLSILAYQHTGQSCGYYPNSAANTFDELNVRQGRYAIWGPIHVLAHVDGSGNPTSPNTPSDASAVAAILNYFIATGRNPDTTPLYSVGSFASSADSGVIGADGGITVSLSQKQTLIAAEAKPAFLVPWCAMEVLRTSEVGPEASYQSPEPCSCFFEETVQGAPVSGHTCTPCSDNGGCSGLTPVCRYGYCEVQ